MKVTFLGTGTSQGVPFIGCDCPVCTSPDPRDNRLRSSIHIATEDKSFIIDTGPDFRYQMLRSGIRDIDAVIYTHGHKDHIAGMDDIRAYNYWQQKAIDIYGTEATLLSLRREFDYVFARDKYPGIPDIVPHIIDNEPFEISGVKILPIKTMHYKMEVFGYRIGDFTYITDANKIDKEELLKIKGSKYFVINALRKEEHISHFNLEQAIAIAEEAGAAHTYFTHISHQLGRHEEVNPSLPASMQLAYDGLSIEL